jgi:hypothetical protein
MSDPADTPETYVAWRYLEVTKQLRPRDGELAEMLRGQEELDHLLPGTGYSFYSIVESYDLLRRASKVTNNRQHRTFR